MNIKDFDKAVEVNDSCYIKDRLEMIFEQQKKLMEKYHKIEKENGLLVTESCPVNLDDSRGQARLKDFAWRITEELGEAMNCLKNKPWKNSHMVTDQDHYLEEIADAFHFFIELCLLSGLDAESLFELYFKKSKVNEFRQRSNY